MKRPLIYYVISLFLGCFSTLLLNYNRVFGAVVAASFFCIIYYTKDIKYSILIFLFFIMGAVDYSLYFNIVPKSTIYCRIVQKKTTGILGDYKGRKIILRNNLTNIDEGEIIQASGKFQSNIEYEKGIIGYYDIENIKYRKKDLIYKLYDIKRKIYSEFKPVLGEEKSALVMSLAFGDTKYLSKSDNLTFQKLGVIHAVSVSGLHISLIYKVLERLLGLKLAVFFSFIYVLFTGLSAPAVRAFITIFIYKISKKIFKNYDSLSSLSFAALIIILTKPYYILDLGFNLSFLSTLGIILYFTRISRFLYKLPKMINEILSVTFSAQCYSLPYIAFTLNFFGSGFILGNLFLLPIYSLIVVIGNLALLASAFKPLFNLICFLLNIILTAVDGADYLLLKICPPIYYLTYLEGILILVVYLCYLLYKNGHKRFKIVPIYVTLFYFLIYFSPVPQVYFYNTGLTECAVLRYLDKSILICSFDDENAKYIGDLRYRFKTNNIITNPYNTYSINLGKNIKAKTFCNRRDSNLNVALYDTKKYYIFQEQDNNDNYNILKNSGYDIIKLPSFHKIYSANYINNESNMERSALYIIVFNNVLRLW